MCFCMHFVSKYENFRLEASEYDPFYDYSFQSREVNTLTEKKKGALTIKRFL